MRGLTLALGASLAACSGQAGPTDEAIARYANTGQSPAATASQAGATAPGAGADAAGATLATRPAGSPGSPAKRVSITVERATGVPDMDPGPGTSDCYVVLAYEGQRFKTSVVEGSEAPVWGDSTVFDVRPGGVLEVTLLDEDSFSSDEKLGVQTLPLPAVAEGETQPIEVAFKGGKNGKLTLTVTGLARP
ncbi:MAG: C2 domain-containing protein [Myxococcota bacterium]